MIIVFFLTACSVSAVLQAGRTATLEARVKKLTTWACAEIEQRELDEQTLAEAESLIDGIPDTFDDLDNTPGLLS